MKTSSRSRNSGVSKDVGKELRIETAFQSSHLKDVTPDVHYVETHHVLNLLFYGGRVNEALTRRRTFMFAEEAQSQFVPVNSARVSAHSRIFK